MKTSLKSLPAAIAALAAALAACSSDGCLQNQSAIPLAAIFSSESGKAVALRGLRIHGIGAPGDSLLVDSAQTVSELYLPMHSSAPSTSWCIAYTQEGLASTRWNDTVTFDYIAQPFFASEECGAMYKYIITDVRATHNVLDSVVVLDSVITNLDIVRIRLYYPVLTDGGTDSPAR